MNYCELVTRVVLLLSMVKLLEARSGLRIIDGRSPMKDEFPYVVRLEVVPVNVSGLFKRTICTASVLTATWTLTAAHCIQFLEKYSAKKRGVKYKNMIRIKGAHNEPFDRSDSYLSNIYSPSNEVLFEILSYYKHPAFKGLIISDIILIENDIGLLNTESISLKQYAKVSAVDFSTVTGQQAMAVGYGVTVIIRNKDKNMAPLPRPLKVLNLIVIECPKVWHLYPAMCVAQRCGRSPTMCAGDSGGPLIHASGIIAITSVNDARDCTVEAKERTQTIGIFTAISPYLTWITSHIISGH